MVSFFIVLKHFIFLLTGQTTRNALVGDYGEEGPPDPISNSEAKLLSADGTAIVRLWESRSLPTNF
jgi:hypothetical protein